MFVLLQTSTEQRAEFIQSSQSVFSSTDLVTVEHGAGGTRKEEEIFPDYQAADGTISYKKQ